MTKIRMLKKAYKNSKCVQYNREKKEGKRKRRRGFDLLIYALLD